MSIEETRRVLDGYFGGHDPDALADDAVFIHAETDEVYEGKEAIAEMLSFIYGSAFEAAASLRNLAVGDGVAIGEFRFSGTHVGEFAGIPATGRTVEYDFAVAYTVDGGQVTEGRMYIPHAKLIRQLTE